MIFTKGDSVRLQDAQKSLDMAVWKTWFKKRQ